MVLYALDGAESFADFEVVAPVPELAPELRRVERTEIIQVSACEFAGLAEIQTLYHAKRALRRICETTGIAAFALLRLRCDGATVNIEMVTSNWNGDPSDELKSAAEGSPRFRAELVDNALPFTVDAGSILVEAPATSVVALPLYCERARGVMLVAHDGPAQPATAYGSLHLFSLYLFAQLTASSRPRVAVTPLAPRETECLRWSAAGKTSSEIAGIIGVSENTVNSYLSSAAQKMNAVNRVQTVAQAIRLGLLS